MSKCALLLLYHVFQEEAIPELEIDVDELLDMPSDVERAARVKVEYRYKAVSKHARTHGCKRQNVYSDCLLLFCRSYWLTVSNPLRYVSSFHLSFYCIFCF